MRSKSYLFQEVHHYYRFFFTMLFSIPWPETLLIPIFFRNLDLDSGLIWFFFPPSVQCIHWEIDRSKSHQCWSLSHPFFCFPLVTDVELKRLKDAFKRTSGPTCYMTQQCFYREVLGDGVPHKVAEVSHNLYCVPLNANSAMGKKKKVLGLLPLCCTVFFC